MNKRGYLSLGQILILIVSVFAFAYLIGMEFKVVSSINEGGTTDTTFPEKIIISEELSKTINEEDALNKPTSGASSMPTLFGESTLESNWKSFTASKKVIKNKDGTQYKFTSNGKDYIVQKNGNEIAYYDFDSSKLITNKAQIAELNSYTHLTDTGYLSTLSSGDFLFKDLGGNLLWAIGLYGVIKTMGGDILGMDKSETDAFAKSAAAGLFVGKSVASFIDKAYSGVGYGGLSSSTWGGIAGIATAAIVYAATYEDEKTEIYNFNCGAWHPPAGGANCEKCNAQEFPCSEYQCKSLGEACELINKGTTEEKCFWQNRNDATAPVITPWNDALTNDDYKYSPEKAISPGVRGVTIDYSGDNSDTKCIPAFTPFSFGIQLDEPAKCRIDYERIPTYDEMRYEFGGSSMFRYNHTNIMSLPSPKSLEAENITLENGGIFTIYVKCQDPNGNYNKQDFGFKFCVDDSEDVTPPVIEVTNPLNNAPVQAGLEKINVDVYLNEPAKCKWSHTSQNYDQMPNTMDCATRATQMNIRNYYGCSGTFDGLQNKVANDFYIQCQDLNENKNQITKYTLMGTQSLYINSAEPNNTIIKNATNCVKTTIKMKTSAGYNEGISNCSFSATSNTKGFVGFQKTNSFEHTQELCLAEGNYTYYLKCVDAGGNVDEDIISFTMDADREAPLVARAVKLSDDLMVITDEKSDCVYSTTNCQYNFEDGIPMVVNDAESKQHTTQWDVQEKYYVKCRDEYNNEPVSDECSITIQPFSYEKLEPTF